MRRIIIAAILTVISAVGVGTSFAVNDLPNFGEWMKTNEQQFRNHIDMMVLICIWTNI